jgi:hypothetical protein
VVYWYGGTTWLSLPPGRALYNQALPCPGQQPTREPPNLLSRHDRRVHSSTHTCTIACAPTCTNVAYRGQGQGRVEKAGWRTHPAAPPEQHEGSQRRNQRWTGAAPCGLQWSPLEDPKAAAGNMCTALSALRVLSAVPVNERCEERAGKATTKRNASRARRTEEAATRASVEGPNKANPAKLNLRIRHSQNA